MAEWWGRFEGKSPSTSLPLSLHFHVRAGFSYWLEGNKVSLLVLRDKNDLLSLGSQFGPRMKWWGARMVEVVRLPHTTQQTYHTILFLSSVAYRR
jgi:hypothetical protein